MQKFPLTLEGCKIDTKVMPHDTCGFLHTFYIGMCNEVAFANRMPLYACKLSWVKITLQKPCNSLYAFI